MAIDVRHGSDDIERMVKASEGNPGAAMVLSDIAVNDPEFSNTLLTAIEQTSTRSLYLWVVYKDICKYDIEKTMEYLKGWFTTSTQSLDLYVGS